MKLTGLEASLKIVAGPISIMAGSLIMLLILINISLPSINQKLTQVNESKRTNNSLGEHLKILREFQAGVLDDRSDITYTVFPDKNPGALMLAQMQTLSTEDNLKLEKVDFSPPESFSQTMFRTKITYDIVSSDYASIFNYLNKMKNTAPASTINELKISTLNDNVRGTITASVYWSALPAGLPSITQPITDLAPEEKVLLSRVYEFRLPEASTQNPSELNPNRQNPFN